MQTELQKEWGAEYNAKVTMAQQAASVIMQKGGIGAADMALMSEAFKAKVGDAATMKVFATIGQMLGEDNLVGMHDGAGNLGTTPAEARQKLAQMEAPGGEYYEALSKKDREALARLEPERDRLIKLAG